MPIFKGQNVELGFCDNCGELTCDDPEQCELELQAAEEAEEEDDE